MDYDERLELAIASDDEWTRFVQAVRKSVRAHKLRHVVSPRASIKGGKLLAAGMSRDKVEQALLWRSLSESDIAKIRADLIENRRAA
jgi:predicted hydrolase (HD superfamily)